MHITVPKIKDLFPRKIYLRGLDYFNRERVKLLKVDDESFIAQVTGSKAYIVRVADDEGYWQMDCDCPYWDDCKHEVAALLAAEKYYKMKPRERRKKSNWKQHFNLILQNRSADYVDKNSKWKPGFVLNLSGWRWRLEAYRFKFRADGSPGPMQFLDFQKISKLNKSPDEIMVLNILTPDQGNSWAGYYDTTFALDANYNQDVGRLFQYLRTCHLYLEMDEKLYPLEFSEQLLSIDFVFKKLGGKYSIRPKIIIGDKEKDDWKHFAVLARKPAILLYDNTLYRVDGLDDAEMLLPFTAGAGSIDIPKNELADFINNVYTELAQRTSLPLPEGIEQITIEEPGKPQLVLEEEPEQLRLFLRFLYGDYQIAYEDKRPTIIMVDDNKIVTIHRDMESEKEAATLMTETRTKKLNDGGWRVLDSRAMNWLFKNIPLFIERSFEILGRENLKKYRVRTGQPNVSVGITSDLDWFDVNLKIDIEGVALSLAELRKAMHKKTKYVKLVDNSIAQLPQDWFERFRHLFNFAEVEQESIKASPTQALFLDMLFEEATEKQTDKVFRENLQRLQKFDSIQAQELPNNFVGALRPYQQAGFDWLYFLKEYKFGGCLADDMGLGKTIQALVLLQKEKENGVEMPSLVVCPTSVVFNWQQEAERFTPQLRTLCHTGLGREKNEAAFEDVDVVFTTYGIIMRDFEFLKQINFHYLILDESQKIKNPGSQSAFVARHLKSNFRLALTGTPVENNTIELWSQFAFLNPGMLGTLHYFKSAFATQIEKYKDEETASLLQKTVFPFILRRTKEKVAKELPNKSEQLLLCDLSEQQKKVYERWRDVYRAKILKLIEDAGLNKSRMNVLEGLTKLRQLACHPALIEPEIEEDSGKFEMLFELVEEIVREGHKLLLFSQFVKMLTLIRRRFEKLDIPYEYLDGRTRNRQERVERFQNDDNIRAFLISLKAGGTGLNLTAADYVIHYDPWWNPAVEMQATDRAYRIGQDKNVFVYKLISKDTVEEKIVKLQERKKKLVSDLITTETGFFKNLDRDDIEVLFS